jgi:hypothetical protein
MKNYEGIDIGDNVKECAVCRPNCGEKREIFKHCKHTYGWWKRRYFLYLDLLQLQGKS